MCSDRPRRPPRGSNPVSGVTAELRPLVGYQPPLILKAPSSIDDAHLSRNSLHVKHMTAFKCLFIDYNYIDKLANVVFLQTCWYVRRFHQITIKTVDKY